MKLVYTSHRGFQIRIYTPSAEPHLLRCVARSGVIRLFLRGDDVDVLEADAREAIDRLVQPFVN